MFGLSSAPTVSPTFTCRAASANALGSIAFEAGSCTGIYWLVYAGGGTATVGLGLFIAWAAACAKTTDCSVLRAIFGILWGLMNVGIVVGVVNELLQGLLTGDWFSACARSSAIVAISWAAIFAYYSQIMSNYDPDCHPPNVLT